jgi:cytidine deaminase
MIDRSGQTSQEDVIAIAVSLASQARERAYAPYSGFRMGAALVGADGRTVTGVLVENVSLGLAMCAERVALFTAVDQLIEAEVLAVASRRTDDELTFPCGACLQVALELAGPELLVVAVDPAGVTGRARLADLLPKAPQRHTFSA